jgi:hypothetical protein
MHDSKRCWRRTFWIAATVAFPLFAWVMIWSTAASGYFIRVLDMEYDRETQLITMTREVLSRDDVLARWHMNVQMPGGRECSASGTDIYEPRFIDGSPKNQASFPAGALAPCLDVADHQIVASWQVLLGGVLPLRPTFFFKPPRT